MEKADLAQAYDGSFYTILGTGGDLAEWRTGVEHELEKRGIGKPAAWFQTTGGAINEYAAQHGEVTDPFPADLTCLMFPLSGLNGAGLAIFKLMAGDRWFDDIVQNMVESADDDDEDGEECEHGMSADLCGGPMHWYDETNR